MKTELKLFLKKKNEIKNVLGENILKLLFSIGLELSKEILLLTTAVKTQ